MFELLQLGFMQNALLACLFGGASLSLIGVPIMLLDIPFLGISLAHVAFLGAILGLLTGVNPLFTAMVLSGVASLLIGPLVDRTNSTTNSILSIIFSATMALALLLLTFIPGPKTEALNLIWGSILTLSRGQIQILAGLFALTAGLTLIFFRELSAVLFDREIAAASGIPEHLFYYGLVFCAGMVISACLDIVGGMLLFALLVNPANTAYQLTYSLRNMYLIAAGIGVTSCLAGLLFSYLFNIPTGAVIVLVSSGFFFLASLLSPKKISS
jgi:manganese/iron transport system permease protein